VDPGMLWLAWAAGRSKSSWQDSAIIFSRLMHRTLLWGSDLRGVASGGGTIGITAAGGFLVRDRRKAPNQTGYLQLERLGLCRAATSTPTALSAVIELHGQGGSPACFFFITAQAAEDVHSSKGLRAVAAAAADAESVKCRAPYPNSPPRASSETATVANVSP